MVSFQIVGSGLLVVVRANAEVGELVGREVCWFVVLDRENIKVKVQYKVLMVEWKLGEWEGVFVIGLQGRMDYENFEEDLKRSLQGFFEGIKGDFVVEGDCDVEMMLGNVVDVVVNQSFVRL